MTRTYTQLELVWAFGDGETSGNASNMEIIQTDDGATELVGHGQRVYARRDGETGRVTLFDGWRGHSIAATRHLNKVCRVADEISTEAPRLRVEVETR